MSKHISEVPEFHPLVAQWLTEHGYSYQHHVRLEDGIADFTAEHVETHEKLVIECKTDSSITNGRAFAQVLDYARQLPEHTPYVAMPLYKLTDKAKGICIYYGVGLILIDAPRPEQGFSEDQKPAPSEHDRKIARSVSFLDQVRCQPDLVIDEVLHYHELNNTNPIEDLLRLYMLTLRNLQLLDKHMGITVDDHAYKLIFEGRMRKWCQSSDDLFYLEYRLSMMRQPSFLETIENDGV